MEKVVMSEAVKPSNQVVNDPAVGASKPAKRQRYRGFTFTVQNWDFEDYAAVGSLYEDDTNATYLIIGVEEAGRTGTPHLQCFIYYTNPMDIAVFDKNLEKTVRKCHNEPSRAKNPVCAYYYCTEEHDWYEFGERPMQGHRTDLAMIKQLIVDKGVTLDYIIREYPNQWMYHFRAIKMIYQECIRFNTRLVLYDPDLSAIKAMTLIRKHYTPAIDKLYTLEYEHTAMEFAEVLTSRVYRLVFYPNNPKSDVLKDCGEYLLADITSNGWEIKDPQAYKNIDVY